MSVIYDEQKRALELTGIAFDILSSARTDLYLNMRFLDVALSALRFLPDGQIRGTGTDGTFLYLQPDAMAALFRRGRTAVNRQYLHTILHCLFSHLWIRGGRDAKLWDLACDIAVEYIMDGLHLKAIHRPPSALRRSCYRELEAWSRQTEANYAEVRQAEVRQAETGQAEMSQTGMGRAETGQTVPLTAQRIYRFLLERGVSGGEQLLFEREFTTDDHSRWDSEAQKKAPDTSRPRWEDIRDRMQTEMEIFGKESSDGANRLEEQICAAHRKRYDYREFLRRFSVLKEEMQVDIDSFDYIFYNYGMELYGNMPLIEPLETKEVHRVEDFVIVLDTSMSCKGDLLLHFLEETYSILSESESFFRKIHVHILQCDDQVQEDVLITSQEQMKEYLEHFTVKGFGGTDFRPAFARVQELMARKCFTKLRGLIYFTDGYGTFPVKKPPYETAFLFLREDYRDVDVPPWAIKLIIDREDLMKP